MRIVDITTIPESAHKIELRNDKIATLRQVVSTRVSTINPDEDILVYKYNVPCPFCDFENSGFSYDGKYFGDTHINCKYCGIYFRPVVKS